MVNIGGRSKGCSTCRRRKVKCDEKRPICTRCARWNFECDGGKGIAFIDQGKALRLKRASCPAPMLTGDNPREVIGLDGNNNEVAPSISILLKGFEIQIFICYTKTHLLLDGPIGFALDEIQLSDLNRDSIDTKLLHQAILSLSIVFFGLQHKDSQIRDRGYALYGLAMKQLNLALSEPKCYVRDEVCLSVVTLTLLEVFCPTGKDNYVKHMIGLERIIELRGPPSHCSANSFRIYTGVFRMMLYGSLNRRQTSVLAKHEWKSFLLASCPVDGIEEQHLLNSLADCTSLLAAHDAAVKTDSTGDTHRRDVVTGKAFCHWKSF